MSSTLRVRSIYAASCFLGACSVASPPPQPSLGGTPRTTTSELFYDVDGATAEELNAAMLARGPTVSGLPVYATTQWEVTWRLQPTRRAGQCRLDAVEVHLHVSTLLPRWRPRETTSTSKLKADWDMFLAALRTHERGHHDLGLTAARSVHDRLRGFRGLTAQSCDALVTEADVAAKKELDIFHERNLRYDVDTAHGANQGVIWPRSSREALRNGYAEGRISPRHSPA